MKLRRSCRRHLARATALVLSLVAGASSIVVGPAVAAVPRTSLTDVEADVMCVSCREPLALAQSPQAIAERAFIRGSIARA